MITTTSMRSLRIAAIGSLAISSLCFMTTADAGRPRFNHSGRMQIERTPDDASQRSTRPTLTEALAGFDNRTNGFNWQGPPYEWLNEDNVVPLRSFNDNRFIFEEVETVDDGLGPTYNAQSCRECHQNVVTGGASQIAEHRTGSGGRQRILRIAGRLADPVARARIRMSWSE